MSPSKTCGECSAPFVAEWPHHNRKTCSAICHRHQRAKERRRFYDRHSGAIRAASRSYYHENKASVRVKAKAYRKRTAAVDASRRLEGKFGISLADYDQMLAEQGGVCGVCRRENSRKRRFAVDHSHSTGKVRRLLCDRCNQGLGLFRDSPELLRAAATYLEVNS